MSELPELPPCPDCGGALRLEFKYKAKLVSLAGAQMKVGATANWPFLVCACGFEEAGKICPPKLSPPSTTVDLST
jgi:hypothetical protein